MKLSPSDTKGAELFSRSIWGIREGALRSVEEHLKHFAGAGVTAEAIEALRKISPTAATAQVAPAGGGSVAIIPLQGIITPRGGLLSLLMGGSYGGLTGFREALREAMSDEDVASILLVVDSPGGLVDLVPETAAEIRAASANKKIVAIANTEANSAAYWLASQANELVVTPSGMVGSIGVFLRHEEISRMAEMEGVKITTIRAGKYKAEANPFEPLTPEAEQHLQETVETIYGMFIADVAGGRDAKPAEVTGGFGEGRVILAKQAVELGMADRVATIEEVIAEMTGSPAPSPRPEARVDPAVPALEDDAPKPEAVDKPAEDDPPEPAVKTAEERAADQRQLADLLLS